MGVVHKIRNPKYQKSFIMKRNIFTTLLIPRLFSRLLKSLRRCGRKLMSGIIEFPLIFWTEILLIFPREILLIFPTEILLASPAKFAFTVTQPWWFKTIADVIKEAILKKVPKVRTYSIWWRAQPPSISSQDLFRRKSVASTNPCQSVLCPPQFEQFRKNCKIGILGHPLVDRPTQLFYIRIFIC